MSDTPKRKRRWLQFSLRSLLVFTVLCAIAAAWLGRKIERKRQEQAIVEEIRKHWGEVEYDYGKDEPESSKSLQWLLGENFFSEVRVVRLIRQPATELLQGLAELTTLRELDLRGASLTDAGLENLKGLAQLRDLNLSYNRLTDEGLRHLRGLKQLQLLGLNETEVTDTGLGFLEELSQLKTLHFGHTKVSDKGLEKLSGMTQLQNLDLSGTKISDAGLANLKG